MKRFMVLAAIVAIVSACAKDPEQIAAVSMDDTTYARQNCTQLAKQEVYQEQLLKALSADQKKAKSGDAWGVFLLGLPISSMSGNDKETQIAVTKGRLDAIERQKSAKKCA